MNESNVGGKLDQIGGKIKQGVGEAFGDQTLANEGAADQVKGHAKEAWGDVKDGAADLKDSAKANAAAKSDHAEVKAEQTGDSFRDKVTHAAEHAKESIQSGIDDLKAKH